MMTVNFHFAENAFLIMAEDLASTQKPEINIESKLFKEGLTSLAGSSEVEKIYNDLTLYGQIRKIPDALLKSFIFTDLKMTYHTDSRSFISKVRSGWQWFMGIRCLNILTVMFKSCADVVGMN